MELADLGFPEQQRRVGELLRRLTPAERQRVVRRWDERADTLSRYDKLTGPQTAELDVANVVAHLGRVSLLGEIRSAVGGAVGQRSGHGPTRSGRFGVEHGDGAAAFPDRAVEFDRPAPTGVFRDAHLAIDGAVRSGLLPDHAAEAATALIEHGGTRDRTIAARWAAAAGSPAYARAFATLVQDPARGHMLWTEEEQEAYRQAELVAGELRAMSLTDSAGGVMVPLTLDPAIMLTNSGVVSPLRQRARVVQTASDQWNGVTSAGVTSEWLAEASEAAAVTPTLGQPSIPVHKLSTYVEYSVEVGMDAINFLAELQKLMLDAAGQTMDTAYALGDGAGKPNGFVDALDGTSSEVAPTTAETFAAADVYKVQNDLGPRFQPNASWMANLAIINQLAQFETTNGALKFPEVSSGQLLRRPLDELSALAGTINAAATADNYVLAYGDFRQGFVIVDRIGATFELVPHVLGPNRRPTGQRGAWLWLRTGSAVVVPEALRLLNVATTA
ncbi:phage major capsid protein [Pseudonocardia dioxanivorans]|uniref:phage major capsid protein n=1 Tax=Pseudonocardia dioxanivorans TaxID=240495 RepID=UPI0018F88F12|nr:phage major capsid protein [Pseudonocardia dioxanivorans]